MSGRYVSFVLGTGRYCVPVENVLQIVRPEGLLPVPKAPAFVEGVINLRGEVIPVVSLRSRMGLAPNTTAGSSRARVVVVKLGGRSCGLAVDEVREIVEIPDDGVQGDPTEAQGVRAEFIQGVAHRGENLFLILDLPRVLSAGRDLQGASPA